MRNATDKEVDELNAAEAANPLAGLPPCVQYRLDVNIGLHTREQVEKAFTRGDLCPGKYRGFGKTSYAAVAKWLGRVGRVGRGHTKSYVEGMERALEILELGGSKADLAKEVKRMKRDMAAKCRQAQQERQAEQAAKHTVSTYRPHELWWAEVKSKQA